MSFSIFSRNNHLSMELTLSKLFETCGYLATFIGTLLEGEVSLLTSVIGAKLGYFNLYGAMIAAFGGAWVADWFKFIVSKTKGKTLLEKKPKLKAKFDKHSKLFDKYPYTILTVYKFFFGFTNIILIMSGLKNISYFRFALHTGIAICLWILVVGGFGFFCAKEMIANLKFLSTHKLKIMALLSTIALLVWFFKKRPFQKACLEC